MSDKVLMGHRWLGLMGIFTVCADTEIFIYNNSFVIFLSTSAEDSHFSKRWVETIFSQIHLESLVPETKGQKHFRGYNKSNSEERRNHV